MPEKKVFDLYDKTNTPSAMNGGTRAAEVQEARLSQAEHQSRVEQRVAKVRELNQRLAHSEWIERSGT